MRGKKSPKRRANGAVEKSKRTTILIPTHIHEVGRQRAKSEHRSLSSYLTTLIEADALAGAEAAK